jgi:hypothetical protein
MDQNNDKALRDLAETVSVLSDRVAAVMAYVATASRPLEDAEINVVKEIAQGMAEERAPHAINAPGSTVAKTVDAIQFLAKQAKAAAGTAMK